MGREWTENIYHPHAEKGTRIISLMLKKKRIPSTFKKL